MALFMLMHYQTFRYVENKKIQKCQKSQKSIDNYM